MSSDAAPFLSGALAGLSVAVPVGPLGLLCIERSLRSGFGAGFSTGLGGVTTNLCFAAPLLAGLQGIPHLPDGGGRTLATLGGLFLLWSAVRVLSRPGRTIAVGGRAACPRTRPPWASFYLSAVALNAGNPLGIVLVLAALSPAVALPTMTPHAAATFLAGMAGAASAWWALLSFAVSALRTRLRPNMLVVANRLAGLLLGAYAARALLQAWSP